MKFENINIFSPDSEFCTGDLCWKDGVIVEEIREENGIDGTGYYAIPGLLDLHFHGCVGHDFCDGTKEALDAITKYELYQGITAICPASMTFPEERLAEIFSNAASYEGNHGADLIGINMEGPFVSEKKKGAQNGAYIQKPDADKFLRLQKKANGLIKLLDIAPETEGAMECIKRLKGQVRISIAHTEADYETAAQAFDNGASHVTHLYNAMPSLHHREPGVIGAACERENCMVELITDGVHIHPAMVRATFQMFGPERVILISDSMMATGLEDGQYQLGGQPVTVKGNLATLTEGGNIAGSATNLMDCVRTAVKDMGIPLHQAIRCASYNPAKALGVEQIYGSLEAGTKADIVILDQDLKIQYLIKDGKILMQP